MDQDTDFPPTKTVNIFPLTFILPTNVYIKTYHLRQSKLNVYNPTKIMDVFKTSLTLNIIRKCKDDKQKHIIVI